MGKTKIGHDFQKKYEKCKNMLAQDALKEAEAVYAETDSLLIRELGLDTFHSSDKQMSVRSLKSIVEVGRIDAEYYQPKYDELNLMIKRMGDGTVKTECNLYDQIFNPKDSVKYKYIELANVGNSGNITGCTYDLGSELPTRARRIVHAGNIILSSIEGSSMTNPALKQRLKISCMER